MNYKSLEMVELLVYKTSKEQFYVFDVLDYQMYSCSFKTNYTTNNIAVHCIQKRISCFINPYKNLAMFN